jgi:hypothetical protein
VQASPLLRLLLDLALAACHGTAIVDAAIEKVLPEAKGASRRRFAAWLQPKAAATAANELLTTWCAAVSDLLATLSRQQGGSGLYMVEPGEPVQRAGSECRHVDFVLAGVVGEPAGDSNQLGMLALPPSWDRPPEPLNDAPTILAAWMALVPGQDDSVVRHRRSVVAATSVVVARVDAVLLWETLLGRAWFAKPSTTKFNANASVNTTVTDLASQSEAQSPLVPRGRGSFAPPPAVTTVQAEPSTKPLRDVPTRRTPRAARKTLAPSPPTPKVNFTLSPEDPLVRRQQLLATKLWLARLIGGLDDNIRRWVAEEKVARARSARHVVATRAQLKKDGAHSVSIEAEVEAQMLRNRHDLERNPVAELKQARLRYHRWRSDIIDQLRTLDGAVAPPPSTPQQLSTQPSATTFADSPSAAPSLRPPTALLPAAVRLELPITAAETPATQQPPPQEETAAALSDIRAMAAQRRELKDAAELERSQRAQEKREAFLASLMLDYEADHVAVATQPTDVDYRPHMLRATVATDGYASHVHLPLHLRQQRFAASRHAEKRADVRAERAEQRAAERRTDAGLVALEEAAARLHSAAVASAPAASRPATAGRAGGERPLTATPRPPATPRAQGGGGDVSATRVLTSLRAGDMQRRRNFEEQQRVAQAGTQALLDEFDVPTVVPAPMTPRRLLSTM